MEKLIIEKKCDLDTDTKTVRVTLRAAHIIKELAQKSGIPAPELASRLILFASEYAVIKE